ncbi:MAG TPA: hypothetical protein VG935_05180 [Patescibacteria group bacterium]|nr:hypothetical protein [Patescibacteria group bacterium]
MAVRSELDSLTTRRKFVRQGALLGGGALIFTGGMGADRLLTHSHENAYQDIDDYRLGYPEVSPQRERDLLASLMKVEQGMDILFQDSHLIQGIFHGHPTLPNYLMLSGQEDPRTRLNVFAIEIAGQSYVVPLLQTKGFAQASLYLGDMTGPQEFVARHLDVPFPYASDVADVFVSGYAVKGDDFVLQTLRNTPRYILRKENQDEEHVSVDIPLHGEITIGEKITAATAKEEETLISHALELATEKSGHTAAGLDDAFGRMTDYDTLFLSKANADHQTTETAVSESGHKVHITLHHPPLFLPRDQRNNLQITTKNNMVQQVADSDGKYVASFLPDKYQYYLGDLTSPQAEARELAARLNAMRAAINQGRISPNDARVEEFIRNELNGDGSLIYDFIAG